MRKQVLMLSLFIFSIVAFANWPIAMAKNSYSLYFSYQDGVIKYRGCERDYLPPKASSSDSTDWSIQLYNTVGDLVSVKMIDDPRIEFYDEVQEDGSLSGGIRLKDHVDFMISVYGEDIRRIKIFSSNRLIHTDLNDSKLLQVVKQIPEFIGEEAIDMGRTLAPINPASIPQDVTVRKILDQGPDENRIDLVFISNAYKANEMEKFFNDAARMLYAPDSVWVAGYYKGLYQTSPMKEAWGLFNFYAVFIPNFNYYEYYLENKDNWKPFDSYWEIFKNAIPTKPDGLVQLLGDIYGGGSAGGMQIDVGYGNTFVFAHELGHTDLAYVRDEYTMIGRGIHDNCSEPPPSPTTCNGYSTEVYPNWECFTNLPDNVRWKRWVEPGTPIPTPATDLYKSGVVGAFEGAGWPCWFYRPQWGCLMNNRSGDFCVVDREQMNLKLLTKWIEPIVRLDCGFSQNASGELLANYSIILEDPIFDSMNLVPFWYNGNELLTQYEGQTTIAIKSSYFKEHPLKTIKVKLVGNFIGAQGFIRKDFEPKLQYSFPTLKKAMR